MKIVIKGGVWKNTEDEILKAGVMKYGLNQWARISSLLNRKSAKQCKARWYEWLDPAIKKTEWTREEDEKLLHLAKLMPTQWRTIAPIVGRTATQCLERYERLLDMASGADIDDDANDARKLRPGEIDPHPESKPARPDAVDMDDDEKEMLSEARARLANTKGKKAKRKAREKQLEEARRLASLQKKRELRAAGIQVKEKAKKKGEIDYATEVPFEKRPAPGFYDVSEENARTKELREEFKAMTKEELEGRKRRQEQEADAKRMSAKRKLNDEKDKNVASMLKQELEMEEQRNLSRRGKMMLPAPQVSDMELEMLAKDGTHELAEGGNAATRTLMGDYSTPAMSFSTPMRTPAPGASGLTGMSAGGVAAAAAGAGGNRLMIEAQALARLQQGQTPLLGGDNLDISGSDFTGITPARTLEATPNPLAAAAAARMAGAGPPGGGSGIGKTPGTGMPQATPQSRDAFHLNIGGGVMDRARVKNALSSLPAPKGVYQLAPAEFVEGDEEGDEDVDTGAARMEEDATDREARVLAERKARLAIELKMRSSVIQKNLPRPSNLANLPKIPTTVDESNPADLIRREMVKLIREDAERFPHGEHIDDAVKMRHEFTYEELQEAAKCIKEEREMSPSDHVLDVEAFSAAWTEAHSGRVSGSASIANNDNKEELEAIKRQIAVQTATCEKLEQKAGVMLAGLRKRNAALADGINLAVDKVKQASIDKACYSALLEQEERAVTHRLEDARSILSAQEDKERALQDRYKIANRLLQS
jgi:pre-mRNA-splicing factor CDC5/CEF1